MNKKLIPFAICGVLAWLTLFSAIIFLKIDANKSEEQVIAATTEQRSVPDNVPAVSSARRFDTLTEAEQDTFNFIFEEEINKEANKDLQREVSSSGINVKVTAGLECGKDIVYFYIDTDSATLVSRLIDADSVEAFGGLAAEAQDLIYETVGKHVDYGYYVYYKGKLEFSSTGSGRSH